MDFNETRDDDDGVAASSAGPYADHLHFAADIHPIMQFFTAKYSSCHPTNSVTAVV